MNHYEDILLKYDRTKLFFERTGLSPLSFVKTFVPELFYRKVWHPVPTELRVALGPKLASVLSQIGVPLASFQRLGHISHGNMEI